MAKRKYFDHLSIFLTSSLNKYMEISREKLSVKNGA